MGDRAAKDELFDALADIGRAIGNGRRAELIDVLGQGERHVEELAVEIGQSVANTSFHLRTLANAGLVATRRDGTRVHYRLASPAVARLWAEVRAVAAAHHDELDRLAQAYLGDRSGIHQVSRDELASLIATGEVVVVDVRPAAEFRAGHLPGAISVPPERIDEMIGLLPAGPEVVAYCRGQFCVFADDAVRALSAAGRPARRLVDGFPEWAAEGRTVEGVVPA